MESATIDTENEDNSRVSPPSYCDHLTASLYKIILHCNLNFTNMRGYEDFLSNEILGTHQRTLSLPKIVQFGQNCVKTACLDDFTGFRWAV